MTSIAVKHRHGRLVHSHAYAGVHRHVFAPRASRALAGVTHEHEDHDDGHEHAHSHGHEDGHGHSYGLVDPTIVRSRAGIHAVALSLAVLGVTAGVQVVIYIFSGSVALLADVIHNFADGNHARVDGFVSLGVVASAIIVGAGATIGDPIIGLLITLVILKITWDLWMTVRHSRGAWDETS